MSCSPRGCAPAGRMVPRCRHRSISERACPRENGSRSPSVAPRTVARRSSRPASCRMARRCCTSGGQATRARLRAHRTRVETKRITDVELLGCAQPCVAHPGDTVDVKVSSTLPGYTAEVIRLGQDARPAVPRVALGRFPGHRQDLVSGSYFIAELGEEIPGPAGHTLALWFLPALLAGRPCLMAGLAAVGGWELGIGEDRRVSAVRLEAQGQDADHRVSAGPVLDTGRWYFAAARWDAAGEVSLLVLRRAPRGQHGSASPGSTGPHDLGAPCPGAQVISVGAAVSGRNVHRCFNGKIDTPRLFEGRLSDADLAALAADAPAARIRGLRHEWRFTPGAALPPHRVRDTGPGRCDGPLVNSPGLGLTGRTWTPGTESFRVTPDKDGARTFHASH